MSAWARVLLGRLPPAEENRFKGAAREGQLLVCEPFLLEALYSARDGPDHARLAQRLAALPRIPSGSGILERALAVQARLAQAPAVSHRVKPIDLLLATVAHDQSAGILHYDHDYDVIAQHSGLRLRSVWIAERGSVA